jgi:hemin uptake protein HemP
MPHAAPSAATAFAPDNITPGTARVRAGAGTLLSSRELLGNGREVRIEHEGSEYVLRATRNGKLILTK